MLLASVDVEAWEQDPSLVTEIGLAFFVAQVCHMHVYKHADTHAHGHVYRHVYKHVHRHVYSHTTRTYHIPLARSRLDDQKQYWHIYSHALDMPSTMPI